MSGYDKGYYIGEVVAHGFEEVGAKGTPCLKIDFKVVAKRDAEGDYVETDDKYIRGVTAWFTDKAVKGSIAKLRQYVAWEGTDLAELADGVLIGSQIEVVCNGQDAGGYDEFDFPFEGGGESRIQPNSKVAKHLRNKFNKLAKLTAPKGPAAGKDKDDDVPF